MRGGDVAPPIDESWPCAYSQTGTSQGPTESLGFKNLFSFGDQHMTNNVHAVATFPARRSSPQTPPTWGDCRDAIRAVVKELIKRLPKADERRVGQLLAERIAADEDILEAAALFLAHDALTAEQVRKSRTAPTAKARARRRTVAAKAVADNVTKVKAALILDMQINGKALRFLTVAEVGRLGAGFTKLAERVPADAYVGECVTETEAAQLMGGLV
jgi:hypothetical protein